MTTKTVKCPDCNGTGRVPDQRAIGEEMKALRLAAGMSLREVSEKFSPKKSPSYLMDLERGNRHWNSRLIHEYESALK